LGFVKIEESSSSHSQQYCIACGIAPE